MQRNAPSLTQETQGRTPKEGKAKQTKYERARLQMEEIIDSFGRELDFFNDYQKREQSFLKQVSFGGTDAARAEGAGSPPLPQVSTVKTSNSLGTDEITVSVRRFIKNQ